MTRIDLGLSLRAAAVGGIVMVHPTYAQSPVPGCELQQQPRSDIHVLHCHDGVTVTAERGARFDLIDRDHDGSTDAVSLRSKAVLIDVDSRRKQAGFQVMTPQAIAAVRGTRWAVDVDGGKTSVLVVRGTVGVSRARGGREAILRPGQGVDVEDGSGRLVVRRWPPARASGLLSRLGQ